MLCCERQQEAVREAEGRTSVVQSCSARTVSWAARPLAVGSRPVTHGRNTEQSAVCSHPIGRTAPGMQFKAGPRCLVVPSERRRAITHRQCLVSRLHYASHVRPSALGTNPLFNASVLLAVLRSTAAPKSAQWCWRRRVRPRKVASERSGCQNASCTRRRHLTTPSSGRAKGRFAPFGPPLMSNVR